MGRETARAKGVARVRVFFPAGQGLALFDELGVPLGPEERDGCEATIERLHGELGEASLAELRAEGSAMALERAVAAALVLAHAPR